MSTHLTFDDLYRLDHAGLVMSIGTSVGSLFTGGLIMLGTLCFCLLFEKKESLGRQKIFLQIYIIVIAIAALGLQFTFLLSPHTIAIFHPQSYEEASKMFYHTLRIPMSVFPMLVFAMTDGLFIWRCYVLRQCLGFNNADYWHHMFWAIPGCFWAFNQSAGIAMLIITNGSQSQNTLLAALSAATFASNAAINVYATIFICLCLYAHHRAEVASYGTRIALFRYRYITSLLLQFATITVPIAITTAVSLGLGTYDATFAYTMIPIAGSSQAFTSVLMIHQVLKARTSTNAQIESVNLTSATRTYELTFRDDRPKPVSGSVDQSPTTECV